MSGSWGLRPGTRKCLRRSLEKASGKAALEADRWGWRPKVCTEPWRSQDEEQVRGGRERVSGEEAGHLSEISSPAHLSPHFLGQKGESSPLRVLVLVPWVAQVPRRPCRPCRPGSFWSKLYTLAHVYGVFPEPVSLNFPVFLTWRFLVSAPFFSFQCTPFPREQTVMFNFVYSPSLPPSPLPSALPCPCLPWRTVIWCHQPKTFHEHRNVGGKDLSLYLITTSAFKKIF